MGAIEDILDWSATKLTPWRQDALRRLACQAALTASDENELLNLIKESAGFVLAAKPAPAIPLEKAHFSSASAGTPTQLKSIRHVENVNRLVPSAIATVDFGVPRQTKAQTFYSTLKAATTDAQIEAASTFSAHDQARLDQLTRLLTGSATTSADLTALAAWIDKLAAESAALDVAFSDAKLGECLELKRQAVEARIAASSDSLKLFVVEPLLGVGSDVWRRLWLAARDYSVAEAYPGEDFPVLNSPETPESCVLCQQELSPTASDRLSRFQAFVNGTLAQAANLAEERVVEALGAMQEPGEFASEDWALRVEQIGKRSVPLAQALSSFKANVDARRDVMRSILQSAEFPEPAAPLDSLVPSVTDLQALSTILTTEVKALKDADGAESRAKLVEERAEVEDRKALSLARERLITRRDLLKQDGRYASALAELVTTGITKKANDLVDDHLTKAVLDQYEAERTALEITHLKVALARKSGQTKATFQTNPGTTLTKLASDILSEGEQRALALAAFLTEVAVTDGSGPIVIDEPFIRVGVLTGTRSSAVCEASFEKEIGRPWVDLDAGLFYRRPAGSRDKKQKRYPPVPLAPELVEEMRVWRAAGARYVVELDGRPVDCRKAFATVVHLAKFGRAIVRHTLRHTAATWMMQQGVDPWVAAGFLGMTQETLLRRYGHHHPTFLQSASRALATRLPRKANSQ